MSDDQNMTQIFAALLEAAAKGALGLMVATDPATGQTHYYIGAIGVEDGSAIFAPFGHLTPGIPRPATPNLTLH